jgi:hypothetical protein
VSRWEIVVGLLGQVLIGALVVLALSVLGSP